MANHAYQHLACEEKLQRYIQFCYELKKGIYSAQPERPPEYAKQEVQNAKVEFGQIISEEKQRVKLIAEKENERVINLRTKNEEDVVCPLCLEDLPAIYPPADTPTIMNCCGIKLCKHCVAEWVARQDRTKEIRCFSCRRRFDRKTLERASLVGSENHRGRKLLDKAMDFRKKGKFPKAMDCLKKAADLGYEGAYAELAPIYYYGSYCGFKVEKSLEMAKEFARKGADKGNDACTILLCQILLTEGGSIQSPEHVRLSSIGAYQENMEGMRALATYYCEEARHPNRAHSNKSIILGLYWSGMVLNIRAEVDDLYVKDCHRLFVSLLEHAMRLCWHQRSFFDLEPLTGYSHVPFCNWLRRRAEKRLNFSPEDDGNVFLDMKCSAVWRKICANCGNREKEKLMTCARCKSFSYCSKECQVEHWKAGHKIDCKAHWIEEFFPKIRNPPKKDA